MNNMIENLINGNLADAKRAARRHKWADIHLALVADYGWSRHKAALAANVLKNIGNCWQEYCNAN